MDLQQDTAPNSGSLNRQTITAHYVTGRKQYNALAIHCAGCILIAGIAPAPPARGWGRRGAGGGQAAGNSEISHPCDACGLPCTALGFFPDAEEVLLLPHLGSNYKSEGKVRCLV